MKLASSANEACFKCQRSLLRWHLKQVSFFEGILQQKDRCGFLKHKWYYKIKIEKLKKRLPTIAD